MRFIRFDPIRIESKYILNLQVPSVRLPSHEILYENTNVFDCNNHTQFESDAHIIIIKGERQRRKNTKQKQREITKTNNKHKQRCSMGTKHNLNVSTHCSVEIITSMRFEHLTIDYSIELLMLYNCMCMFCVMIIIIAGTRRIV